jgi:hypothetical protein
VAAFVRAACLLSWFDFGVAVFVDFDGQTQLAFVRRNRASAVEAVSVLLWLRYGPRGPRSAKRALVRAVCFQLHGVGYGFDDDNFHHDCLQPEAGAFWDRCLLFCEDVRPMLLVFGSAAGSVFFLKGV